MPAPPAPRRTPASRGGRATAREHPQTLATRLERCLLSTPTGRQTSRQLKPSQACRCLLPGPPGCPLPGARAGPRDPSNHPEGNKRRGTRAGAARRQAPSRPRWQSDAAAHVVAWPSPLRAPVSGRSAGVRNTHLVNGADTSKQFVGVSRKKKKRVVSRPFCAAHFLPGSQPLLQAL